jgi:hypothetical protein
MPAWVSTNDFSNELKESWSGRELKMKWMMRALRIVLCGTVLLVLLAGCVQVSTPTVSPTVCTAWVLF